ncbi:hypothetical protein N6L24_09850 [Cognatishimia sp. SS12]|uniref:hypothetical protein n=1 Tax=Cognatishimia sp. SS12 TaxID=2979465 RepID=UPI0023307305|nr:hypothetical protein [Cognatishimia sp. SS12]MDC0738584.1 hypothetical protein [Cognatishimia sp. SS12]
MRYLRQTALITALCLGTASWAGSHAEAPTEEGGNSLMRQGIELFLRGLTDEIEPALKDLEALADSMGPELRSFLQDMGPAFADLLDEIEDWSVYEPPEILPNGDIIIRRKPDTLPDPDAAPGIEL